MSLTRHSGTARSAGPGIHNHPLKVLLHSRGGARLVEMIIAAHRRTHQEAVALLDDAFAIAGFDMRMADDDVVLPAGLDHPRHLLQQLGVLILARDAELLPEVAFANQYCADALHLGEHLVEVLDATHVLDL